MAFLAGSTLVFNATYRTLQLYYNKNSFAIVLISIGGLATASFAFYVVSAAPSVDPLAGLANHIHESSLLCLLSAITLGAMSVTEARQKTLHI